MLTACGEVFIYIPLHVQVSKLCFKGLKSVQCISRSSVQQQCIRSWTCALTPSVNHCAKMLQSMMRWNSVSTKVQQVVSVIEIREYQQPKQALSECPLLQF